ncbi:MAG: S-methyl-5-thioribose-1-phosphate isomerase [Microbacteriaceae bacterium]
MSVLPPSVAWSASGGTEAVAIIDQRLLPGELVVRRLESVDAVIDAIATLAVRGANVIGSAGGLGLALGIRQGLDAVVTADRLIAARPTAVNLAVAVNLVLAAHRAGLDPLERARGLIAEDTEQTRLIGEFGRAELTGIDTVLTHCNTGRLATTGWGTALGVIYAKQAAGEPIRVLATETRPLRQGARLTAWELHTSGIDVTLIPDSAAASALGQGLVGAVIVGADRIAANGDTANKIGTRALAVAAAHAGIPFYVAATLNAVDLGTASGDAIEIEERDPAEMLEGIPVPIPVWNPAFDVTPGELIAGIITEAGVLRPPYAESLKGALL